MYGDQLYTLKNVSIYIEIKSIHFQGKAFVMYLA